MPRSTSILFGLASLIGSVIGLIFMAPLLLQGGMFGFPGELLLFVTFALYSYGVWSGLQALRQRAGWPKGAKWFWLAQVPAYSSPVFSLFISCAAGVWPYIRFGPTGLGGGVSAYLGSGFRWSYGQGAPFVLVGVNVLALAAAAYLFHASHNERQAVV
jgi:hypothetical protein